MGKVLIYATAVQGSQEIAAYEEAITYAQKGDDVLFLHCDGSVGGCLGENPCFRNGVCKVCVGLQKRRAKRFLPKSVRYEAISSYWNSRIDDIINTYSPQYFSPEEFRRIEYKGVYIGYGAMSTYIQLTRDMDPILTKRVVAYLNKLLVQQVILTELFERACDDFKPDLVVFHNGRLAQYKPILNVCQKKRIHFITTEFLTDSKNDIMKNYFEDCIPHNVYFNTQKYEHFWNNYPKDERELIGRSYFENKRRGTYKKEINFIGAQISGSLPDSWDTGKRHIVIFNSSQDEYCAIDKEVDNAALFHSQIDGIKKIVRHFEGDDTVQLFLRVHPNLSNVQFAYHKDIYKIQSSNFTIIPPDSSISSYSLLDNADLVIVFGSTMGLESAYWGKPTICLAYALYRLLGVVYTPQNEDELWSLLDNPNLASLDSSNCLKYSLYYSSDKHEHFSHVDAKKKDHYLLGHHYQTFPYLTFMGSEFLYHALHSIYIHLFGFKGLSN